MASPPTSPQKGEAWYVRLPLLGCLCGAWGVFSFMLDIFFLTELTDLTEPLCARSELTERLRHTDITERYS